MATTRRRRSPAPKPSGRSHQPEIRPLGDGDAAVFCCGERISPLIDDDDTAIAEYFVLTHLDATDRRDPVRLTLLVSPAAHAEARARFTRFHEELAAA